MKFKAVENSVLASKVIEPQERDAMRERFRAARLLVWHGKGLKAVARIKAIDEELLARPGHEDSTLRWNLRRLNCYIENNASTLVNYGARYLTFSSLTFAACMSRFSSWRRKWTQTPLFRSVNIFQW